MTQAKVWKMREYFVYFPFFILHDWGKSSAEARSSHLSGVALINVPSTEHLAGTLQPIMWLSIQMSELLFLSWMVICRISAHIF